jgi:hypothetical protein
MKLNVNTKANIVLTAKLERLNKTAFPSAVRSTLNDAAFEMKKTNIPDSARKNMTVRNKTVFKKFTGVKKASGFNISSMASEVGFIPKDGVKGHKVPSGMESNEVGGSDDSGFMYMPKTRTSKSAKRLVRRNARYNKSKILKIHKGATNINSKSNSRFIVSAIESVEQKKPFNFATKKGFFLVQATSYKQDKDGKTEVKLDFLMRGRNKFKATSKATHFNREAALKTAGQMEKFYKKNAEYQFNKVWK